MVEVAPAESSTASTPPCETWGVGMTAWYYGMPVRVSWVWPDDRLNLETVMRTPFEERVDPTLLRAPPLARLVAKDHGGTPGPSGSALTDGTRV